LQDVSVVKRSPLMPVQVPNTRWGGIADGHFRPGGFFRIGQCDGVFWLVDPDGGRFLSKSVNTVRFDHDKIRDSDRIPYAEACRRKYGSESAWRAAVEGRSSPY
jgi:agarase